MGTQPTPDEAYGLFVSCVEGQPVARYGSKLLIAAERVADNPRKIRYRTEEIVAIPVAEATRYWREYARAIEDKSLVKRTAAEWSAQQRQPREASTAREIERPVQ